MRVSVEEAEESERFSDTAFAIFLAISDGFCLFFEMPLLRVVWRTSRFDLYHQTAFRNPDELCCGCHKGTILFRISDNDFFNIGIGFGDHRHSGMLCQLGGFIDNDDIWREIHEKRHRGGGYNDDNASSMKNDAKLLHFSPWHVECTATFNSEFLYVRVRLLLA